MQTPEGPQKISILKVGDKVFSLNKDFVQEEKEITRINDKEEEEIIEITTEDTIVLSVSHYQKLFVPQEKKWVKAHELKPGEYLLKKDGSHVKVKEIKKNGDKRVIRYITVYTNHNFFAGENGILVHNFVFTLPFLMWGTGAAMTWFEGVTLAGVASALAGLIMQEAVVEKIEEIAGKDIGNVIGYPETTSDFDDPFRDINNGIISSEKTPGNPQSSPGADAVYKPPKRWDGKKVPSPNGRGWGYPDKNGKVWVPTGENGHGGPHWDVQPKDGKGKHENILPDGTVRGDKK